MIVLMSGMVVGEIYRAASMLLIINPFLLGIGLFTQYNNTSKKRKIAFLLIITGIVCFTAFLGIFAIYPSPWYSSYNTMTTFQEKSCLQWFSNSGDKNIGLISEYLETRRWDDYYYGTGNTEKKIRRINFEIPTHLGYNENTRFGSLLVTKPAYMITNDKMKEYYYAAPEDRRDRLPQYNNNDFEKLNGDSSVEKIYSTGGCETWLLIA